MSLQSTTLTLPLSFSAPWNSFTLRFINICGMILKYKMPLNINSQFVSVFFNNSKGIF